MSFLKYLFVFGFLITALTPADEKENNCPYEFSIIKELPATSVKNQGSTGSCWAFATISFIESELIRIDKKEVDLSEMWILRNAYTLKAEKYVRYHGMSNFGEGGQAHDVMNIIKKYGIVPQSIYEGKTYEQKRYNHGELTSILDGMLAGITKAKEKKLTPKWKEAFESVLNTYMGNPVAEFVVCEESFTPHLYAASLKINPDDYIEFTSYTHHPFYSKIILEIPDNWSNNSYFNVPLDDLINIINNSINSGYTVCWDGDVGKDNFYKNGYAVIPADYDLAVSDNDNDSLKPVIEKQITQEIRQDAFNNYDATDDHLMHIVGIAKDQNETPFYYTKNSWGTKDKTFGGFWYLSQQYLKLKTVAIMVHKNAVPIEILNKFNDN